MNKQHQVTVTIPVTITDAHLQALSDALITAVEGGSEYWASFSGYVLHRDEHGDFQCRRVKIREREPEVLTGQITVTPLDLLPAVMLIAAGTKPGPQAQCQTLLFNPDDTDIDASAADSILQVAVLGDIVYG